MYKDKEFQVLKQEVINKNENKYGRELRESYGEEIVEESNNKFANLSKQEYEELTNITKDINELLEEAVINSLSPKSEEGIKIAKLHKRMLELTWNKYSKDAHLGLVNMYLADDRFKSYYDKNIKGCARFLHSAVESFLTEI